MNPTGPDAAGLARDLVDLLTIYEGELMVVELDDPAIGALRRAVGIAIAEAHYWISDTIRPTRPWTPSAEGRSYGDGLCPDGGADGA